MEDDLPPISFGSRGFVRHDGSVIGWSILDAQHNDYHAVHGTNDHDFATRWRQWHKDGYLDFEERPIRPEWVEAVEAWIEDHANDSLHMP
jgi:hypothetical protein